MTKYTPNTTDSGAEWSINDAGGTRDIELEYEYCCGPSAFDTNRGYVFLSRNDLVAMLKALDDR